VSTSVSGLASNLMSQLSAPQSRCTVLFADLVGSSQLYQQVGDSMAFRLVHKSLNEIRLAAEQRRGQVIKNTGDGLIITFPLPDDAADAAVAMHTAINELRDVDTRMAIRVGFHSGSVIESESDVFGETVNAAARLVELARPGRALTTLASAKLMSDRWQSFLNPLPPRILRGSAQPTELMELKCESIGDITIVHDAAYTVEDNLELRLYLNEQCAIVNERQPLAELGRSSASCLRVGDQRTSRRHANIELRGDKFVVVDRSSNGTYIHMEGEKEFLLSREAAVLQGHGYIALGRSCAANPFVIHFICM